MKIAFQKIVPGTDRSFAILDKKAAAFDGRYHFHPEIEITLIQSSCGRRVVGDSIEAFTPGDLVLLGENLPHQYLSHRAGGETEAWAKVIQFRADFPGDRLLRLPEFGQISQMLRRAGRGLKFEGETALRSAELIGRLFAASGCRRVLLLLELLDVLSRDRRAAPIASAGYAARISSRQGETIDAALDFLNQRFNERIKLEDLCRQLHVSPATCNRLFQRSIGRSFKTALNEIRISHACRLLLETEQAIVEVAHGSGFPNLSNFNRRFREEKGHTPREYRNLVRAV